MNVWRYPPLPTLDEEPALYWDLHGAARAVGRLYVAGELVASVVVPDRDRDDAEAAMIAAAGLDPDEVLILSISRPRVAPL
ncbi:hypothetical protein [Gordonia alkaliphila]|uniref:Uncharacterized protein n=1 Tax=Gordonia alkaliphila TaxID=1053547 RepID=A0ABP8ZKS0_9ACTN